MLAGRDITYETAIPTHSLRLEADVVESIVAHSALAERELKSPLAERASEKPLERGGEREREMGVRVKAAAERRASDGRATVTATATRTVLEKGTIAAE